MEEVVRILVLLFAIISLIYILSHQPRAVVVVNTPYCEISKRIAYKNRFGRWHFEWATGFGPCTLLDRYEDV